MNPRSSCDIYTVPGSPYSRAAIIALEEKRVPYRIIGLSPPDLTTPAYLAIHPFGRMPALRHRGVTVYETQAILRYIDRVWPSPALTPQDPYHAALMDQFLNVCDWYLFQGVGSVIGYERVVAPRVFGAKSNEARIETCLPRARMVLDALNRALEANTWFGVSSFSLADIMIASHLDFLAETPEWQSLTADGALRQWLERVQSRPSFPATTWERVAEAALPPELAA